MSAREPANHGISLLVWDAEGLPPESGAIPVLWRQFNRGDADLTHSIPKRVEETADALRATYLGWIHDLGESRIGGIRVVDHLPLRPSLSYWWMTIPVQLSYGESPRIYQAIRLLALAELAGQLAVRVIHLVSPDATLARAIRLWCRNAGLKFSWQRPGQASAKPKATIAKRLYRQLPHPCKALVYLAYYLKQHWPRRNKKVPMRADLTVVDYLVNESAARKQDGHFGSMFWTSLVDVLRLENVPVNWIHNYIPNAALPSPRHVRDLMARFNAEGGVHSHETLDHALNPRVVASSLADYVRIAFAGIRLRRIRYHFRPAGSDVDLFPLFEQDWRASMFGALAITNSLWLNLLERTLNSMPPQRDGLYLMESQPWEMALVHAWKAAGHGRLIAVPHSTVLYWDLRYWFDPRAYTSIDCAGLPLPDVVAVNGPVMREAFRAGGFPEDRIVMVEALRYGYLQDVPSNERGAHLPQPAPLRILILTDYFEDRTRRQMQWLCAAAAALPDGTRYTVKPHSGCPVIPTEHAGVNLEITHKPLAELLGDYDVAYTSNITSAAVDAYCAGIPVISVVEGDFFNMSPLLGRQGVTYVTSADELAQALLEQTSMRTVPSRVPYFCLDKNLPRWRELLGLECVGGQGLE